LFITTPAGDMSARAPLRQGQRECWLRERRGARLYGGVHVREAQRRRCSASEAVFTRLPRSASTSSLAVRLPPERRRQAGVLQRIVARRGERGRRGGRRHAAVERGECPPQPPDGGVFYQSAAFREPSSVTIHKTTILGRCRWEACACIISTMSSDNQCEQRPVRKCEGSRIVANSAALSGLPRREPRESATMDPYNRTAEGFRRLNYRIQVEN